MGKLSAIFWRIATAFGFDHPAMRKHMKIMDVLDNEETILLFCDDDDSSFPIVYHGATSMEGETTIFFVKKGGEFDCHE